MTGINKREGACGICHAIAEGVCEKNWKIKAYERPDGILARIFDEEENLRGEGFDVVWSSAILSAEIDAGLVPDDLIEDLRRDGTNSEEDVKRVADLYGYGRVITPAVLALNEINAIGGRTLIKREGLGVVSIFKDNKDREISRSPVTYCPTCAIAVGASRTDFLAEKIRKALKNAKNTGKKKYEMGIENRYMVKGGGVRVMLIREEKTISQALGCCIAYGTVKAEINADLSGKESSQLFKTYCNLCPLKHCWMEKSMGAMGNIVLHRLGELGIEVEVTAKGLIIARIPGNGVIEGRGTLCSLSALTNMLLKENAGKILRPSPAKEF
ncbi:MAG: hypothetical protein ACXQS7_06195 [Candidatus Syntropharchaeia archaeon]